MADAVVVLLVACSLSLFGSRDDEHKRLSCSFHFGFAFVLFSPLVRTTVNHVSCVRCHIGLLLLHRKASLPQRSSGQYVGKLEHRG